MKTSSLPNLRGKITNANAVKIELVKAINQAVMYAKRGGLGYSSIATDVLALFEAAKVALRIWTRAASIDTLPATVTKAAGQTQQLATTATYADGVAVVVANTDERMTYASSDVTKATVSKTGLVTAVASGSATITVTYHGRTDTCVVTVS